MSDPGPPAWRALDRARRAVGDVSAARIVAAITAAALAVRLIGLGARPMHYDEARVAYWALHYAESGSLHYRPAIHGPLLQLVDAWLFELAGPSDFLARLPVALVGGLLPLSALLFREHLRRGETVALALFLAGNAFFVYYSRFMRSDVLLAAFAFTGLGALVRFADTRRPQYLYAAAVVVACGFAAKENAVVYVLTWLGAGALLADRALARSGRSGVAVLAASPVGRAVQKLLGGVSGRSGVSGGEAEFDGRRLAGYALHAAGALLLGLAILVFLYADRGAGAAGVYRPPAPPGSGAVGLWEAFGQPLTIPGFAVDTLGHAATEAAGRWAAVDPGGSGSALGSYAGTLRTTIGSMVAGALALSAFALFGILWERYARTDSRAFVLFASYCGVASLVGYSLKSDPGTGYWLTIHIILPLTVPAAVGVARIYRWGRAASIDRDAAGTVLAAGLLALTAVQAGAVTADTAYGDTTSQENPLVQYAQAESDARAVRAAVPVVADSRGTDVLVYTGRSHGERPLVGEPLVEGDLLTRPDCLGTGWYNALPLPWYLQGANASVDCERDPEQLRGAVGTEPPPVIVTNAGDDSVPATALSGYTARTFEWFQFDHPVTVYVHEDWTDRTGWTRP